MIAFRIEGNRLDALLSGLAEVGITPHRRLVETEHVELSVQLSISFLLTRGEVRRPIPAFGSLFGSRLIVPVSPTGSPQQGGAWLEA